MKTVRIALTSLAALASVAWGGVPGYGCRFGEIPARVVSDRPIPLVVHVDVPPGSDPVPMHVEVKGSSYHVIDTRPIGRSGPVEVTLTAPPAHAARQVEFALWLGTDWRNPLCDIVRSRPVEVISGYRARMLAAQETAARRGAAGRADAQVGIYVSPGDPWGERSAVALEDALRAAGLSVRRVPDDVPDNPFALLPERYPVLVLLGGSALPTGASDALPRYVRAGGRLVATGREIFSNPFYLVNGERLTPGAYRDRMGERLVPRPLFDFDDGPGEWARSSNAPESPARVEGAPAPGGGRCVRVVVDDLSGWDTFGRQLAPGSIPPEHALLTFKARGESDTTQLAVELREQDGSRWIGVVTLGPEWSSYALPARAFALWDPEGRSGRGGGADAVRFGDLESIIFGLAFTHTRDVRRGRHEFRVDAVGSAPAPGDDVDTEAFSGAPPAQPVIETVSPSYKTYPVTNLAGYRTEMPEMLGDAAGFSDTVPTVSSHPRPTGTGVGKGRRFRFVPLVSCLDDRGRVVGTAASLVLNGGGDEGVGMVARIGVDDLGVPDTTAPVAALAALIRRMLDGVFLYEGGTAYYSSFGNEPVPVGARVVNRGEEAFRGAVSLRVHDAAGALLYASRQPVAAEPGADVEVTSTCSIPGDRDGPLRVSVALLRDGRAIDRLEHEVTVRRPPVAPEFITIRDGRFRLAGKPWFVHGVNYMPSSGIGIESGNEFEYWLDPAAYDPAIIERDLEDIADIGFNTISVFQYRRSMESRNLLDLLWRCRRRGLRVNLSLRPGTPLAFPWDAVREMIEFGRLARDDTIFAYDLAWEPGWGGEAARRAHDRDWEAWVIRTHGTVAAAEDAWGVPAPRLEQAVTGPSDEQLRTDGPWRTLVLDYRRFLNDLLHERYGGARERVRSIDPNHAVSFRMSNAGFALQDPGSPWYDFAGLGRAVDVFEPEAYGLIGDEEHVLHGLFTVAYARSINPQLPVVWAEFGNTVWDSVPMRPGPEKLAFVERYYEDFYRMALRSGCDGTICWWFPGGYRVNERSDFGIRNPDRSWRGVTRVIQRYAPILTAPRDIPEADVVLEYDRTADVRGVRGIYEQVKEPFWEAVRAGRLPGLRERVAVPGGER